MDGLHRVVEIKDAAHLQFIGLFVLTQDLAVVLGPGRFVSWRINQQKLQKWEKSGSKGIDSV